MKKLKLKWSNNSLPDRRACGRLSFSDQNCFHQARTDGRTLLLMPSKYGWSWYWKALKITWEEMVIVGSIHIIKMVIFILKKSQISNLARCTNPVLSQIFCCIATLVKSLYIFSEYFSWYLRHDSFVLFLFFALLDACDVVKSLIKHCHFEWYRMLFRARGRIQKPRAWQSSL